MTDQPSSLKPEEGPSLEEILRIRPSDERIERLRGLIPFDEEDLTPEVETYLLRREVRQLSVSYNQILAATPVIEDLVDSLVRDSIDTHAHGGSDPMGRLMLEDDLAIEATKAGMRALVIKTWYTPSASRNQIVQRIADRYAEAHGLRPTICFGGVTLNYSMGGFNPEAVKACLGFPNMKYVWMPMVDSYHHRRVVYDDWSGYGLKFTDDHFRIVEPVREILRIIAANDLILAVGHYPYEDAAALVEEARSLGVNRIELVHPNMVHSKHTIEQLKAQAARGAKLMFRSKGLVAYPSELEPPYAVRMIREVGAEHFVHGSDWGQVFNLHHMVGNRWAIKTLIAFGLTPQEIRTIYQDSPADHLGLSRLSEAEKSNTPAVSRAGSGYIADPADHGQASD
jgi:Family of unknown function (DUF6282)